jgi:hypothetical protein
MMRIEIDFSLFLNDDSAVGRVYGALELHTIPQIGSRVSLSRPVVAEVLPIVLTGFPGQLKVLDVIHEPLHDDSSNVAALVLLEPLRLSLTTDIERAINYFESGFHLYVDKYDA